MTRTSLALRPRDPALRGLLSAVRSSLAGDVYVVGGFLRDLLARRPAPDLDLAVSIDAGDAAAAIARACGGHDFALDEDRCQFRVVLPPEAVLRCIDVSPLKGELGADLAARDFTIDAMAAALQPDGSLGPLIDPFSGRSDVEKGTVRLTSEGVLTDDPLRLLRGARIATELDFSLAPETAEAIARRRGLLNRAAAERRRDELCRILTAPRAARGLRLLDSLGLLEELVPEITAARGVVQPKEHSWDVFDHSLETVAVLDSLLGQGAARDAWCGRLRRPFRQALDPHGLDEYFAASAGGQSRLALTKLAGLLHDVGKPETRRPDDTGRIRFFGHAELGGRTATAVCSRLRLGGRETRFVSLLVEEHLRPTQLSQGGVPTNRAIFRFFRDLDEAALACLVLSLADAAAAVGPRLEARRWRGHVAYVEQILARREALAVQPAARRLISGREIMATLGIGPGPEVGRLLAAVDEAAGCGEISTPTEALSLARALHEAGRGEPTGVGAA